MIKRLLFFAALALSVPLKAIGQSSDRVSYDIVYDVSGSIPIFDYNGNLLSLFQQLIRARVNARGETQSINSYADFHIYFIGERADTILGREKFLTIKAKDLDQTQKIIDAIRDQTTASRTQKWTHLHTALDQILADRSDTTRRNISGGVFIFSDAQIGENDFDSITGHPERHDLSTYRKAINLRIAQIQTQLNRPVFLVQSSQLADNEFTMIPDSSKHPNPNKEMLNSGNWFWLRNDLIARSDSTVQKEFQHFIDLANVTIVNYNMPIKVNDKIAATIKIEQIFELLRNLKKENISGFLDKIPAGTMLPEQLGALKQIDALAGKNDFNSTDIVKIQVAIETLSKAPEALRNAAIQVSLQLDTALSLSSNLALNEANFPAVKANVTQVKAVNGESMQAMILNGIAQYLVERVKQEIALYFIEEVSSHSINNAERYREIGEYLLPHTKTIISDPQNYTDINSMRTALLKDISQLPDNLAAHADLFGRSEGLVTLSYFYQLYQNIRQTNSLELSFEQLGKTIEKKIASSPSRVNTGSDGLDRKFSAMEQNILFTSRMIGYLRTHDLSKVFADQQPDTLTKMLSLLSLDPKHVALIKNADQLRPVLNNIYLKYQDLKSTTEKYKPLLNAPASSNLNQYHIDQLAAVNDILIHISDLLLSGTDVLKLINTDATGVVNRFITPIQDKVKMGQHLLVKLNQNYKFKFDRTNKNVCLDIEDSVTDNILITLTNVTDKFQTFKLDGLDYNIRSLNKTAKGEAMIAFEIEQATNKLNSDFRSAAVIRSAQNTMQAYFMFKQQKYADGVNLLIPELKIALRDRLGTDTLVLEHLEKIFRIAGGVVNATSSDDISNIIARNAMPAGSYRTKRTLRATINLNAYAGGAVTRYPGDNSYAPALFAPVGFEFAKGRNGKKGIVKSWGVLLSVLDVGNIINYQIANGGVNQTDVTSLRRAFAPGLNGTVGLCRRNPLAVVFGYQMNPGRINLGVGFDLPILPFMQRR